MPFRHFLRPSARAADTLEGVLNLNLAWKVRVRKAETQRSTVTAPPARPHRQRNIRLDQPAGKIGSIDLMKIADPDKQARKPLTNGALAFPFFTIENVDVIDASHIVVGNDNNLPYSSSREPNKADDNEFVLLHVDKFLKAR
jgi:hypothetical protein